MDDPSSWCSTGNRAAADRAPNLEELKRLVEYPDPRIKALVYTMVSSGILGLFEMEAYYLK